MQRSLTAIDGVRKDQYSKQHVTHKDEQLKRAAGAIVMRRGDGTCRMSCHGMQNDENEDAPRKY